MARRRPDHAKRRGWAIAVLTVAGAAVAAMTACGQAPEARFSATCGPDEALERVNCTVQNHGAKAGRACVTARVQPEQGLPIVAQRSCTSVLEPGQKAGLTAQFVQLERMRRANTLALRCVKGGAWTCKVDIVEEPGMLGENLPASR